MIVDISIRQLSIARARACVFVFLFVRAGGGGPDGAASIKGGGAPMAPVHV